jgi:outer membrane protein assembly factor BamB
MDTLLTRCVDDGCFHIDLNIPGFFISIRVGKPMKKHIISILVLFLMVSTSLVGVTNQVTDDSFMVQQDSYQYMMDWSVHLTNQTPNEETSRPYYNYVESGYMEPSPLSGPMDSAWPTQSHDLFHTGRSQYSTANVMGNELWRVQSDDNSQFLNAALIGKDGTIYYGSTGGDNALYALWQNGTRKWRYQADGAIWGTPAMTENGTIVFTTWGGDGFTHAVKPDGTLLWKKKIGGLDSAASTTIAQDGTIYFGRDDKNIYAVYPNGTLKWVYTTGYIVLGAPAIGDDGTIYEGSGDFYLYALNSNGTLKWKYQTGDYIKGSVTIAPDGTLYMPSFDGYFHALTPNGTLLWKGYTGDHLAARGLALAEDGTIYVGTELLRAYYPDGTLKWQTDVLGEIYNSVPAVSADGTIYVTGGAALVAVNPDGNIKWRKVLTSEQIYSSPSIGFKDTVYVGSQYHDSLVHSSLHAFGAGEPKTIKILRPTPGHLYLFSLDCGKTPQNLTYIIGSATVQVQTSSPEDIKNVSFYFGGKHVSVASPPFSWRMNQRYGNVLFQDDLTVIGYYKDGTSWIESMPVIYFHFL